MGTARRGHRGKRESALPPLPLDSPLDMMSAVTGALDIARACPPQLPLAQLSLKAAKRKALQPGRPNKRRKPRARGMVEEDDIETDGEIGEGEEAAVEEEPAADSRGRGVAKAKAKGSAGEAKAQGKARAKGKAKGKARALDVPDLLASEAETPDGEDGQGEEATVEDAPAASPRGRGVAKAKAKGKARATGKAKAQGKARAKGKAKARGKARALEVLDSSASEAELPELPDYQLRPDIL